MPTAASPATTAGAARSRPTRPRRASDAGEPHVWRIAVPEDRGDITFVDAIRGELIVPGHGARRLRASCARTAPPPTTSPRSSTTCAMEITHVIRGDDHLSNTPRQILVFEALGHAVPRSSRTCPMIWGPDGKRLSKRHGATSVEAYRDEGYLPEALLNYLALLGWSLDGETTIIDADTLDRELRPRPRVAQSRHLRRREARVDERRLHPRAAGRRVRRAHGAPAARRPGSSRPRRPSSAGRGCWSSRRS